MDCGLSCLGMIAGCYGSQPNINTIRHTCALGKGSGSLLGISKATAKIDGLQGAGRETLITLVEEVLIP